MKKPPRETGGEFPHQTVRRFVMGQISTGRWPAGHRLPPEVRLAAEFGVHRLTVHRVLAELAREGVLTRRRGAGSFVCADASRNGRKTIGKGLVGLVTGHHFDPVTNIFYSALFEKMRGALAAQGFYLLPLGDADEFLASRPAPADPLHQLRALVVLGAPASPETLATVEKLSVPAVIVGCSEYDGVLPSVASDDREGAAAIARKLAEAGHSRVAHLNAAPPLRMHDRMAGFLEECEKLGILVPYQWVVEAGGLDFADGKAAALRFLQRRPGCTVLFAGSDSLALGALAAASDLGLRVPGDLSVVGFDGLATAAQMSPPLATMRVPREEIAREAASRLLLLLAGEKPAGLRILLPCEWTAGGTLGAPGRPV